MRSSHLKYSTIVILGLVLGACASAPPPGRVYVVDRPPPARVEVISRAPGPDFIWIGGYWRRADTRWDWVPGHYVRREGGRKWVAGHWAHDRRGWYFVEGRWR